jgi:hypothetical protein
MKKNKKSHKDDFVILNPRLNFVKLVKEMRNNSLFITDSMEEVIHSDIPYVFKIKTNLDSGNKNRPIFQLICINKIRSSGFWWPKSIFLRYPQDNTLYIIPNERKTKK